MLGPARTHDTRLTCPESCLGPGSGQLRPTAVAMDGAAASPGLRVSPQKGPAGFVPVSQCLSGTQYIVALVGVSNKPKRLLFFSRTHGRCFPATNRSQ